MKQWDHGAASLVADFYDGLALAEWRGPVTNEAMKTLQLSFALWLPRDAKAVIFAWDRAVLATTFGQVRQGHIDARLDRLLALPIANLVSTEQASGFHRYAFDAIKRGFLRVTFLERSEAFRWASRKIAFAELAEREALALPVPPLTFRALDFEPSGSRRMQ